MIPTEEEVCRLLETPPEDSSSEDIQYHVYVRQKVQCGLVDVAEGRTLSGKEFDTRMEELIERGSKI